MRCRQRKAQRRRRRKQRKRAGASAGEALRMEPAAYQKKRADPRSALLHRETGYFTFFFEVPFAVVLLEAAVSADEVPVADEVADWFPVVELALVLMD